MENKTKSYSAYVEECMEIADDEYTSSADDLRRVAFGPHEVELTRMTRDFLAHIVAHNRACPVELLVDLADYPCSDVVFNVEHHARCPAWLRERIADRRSGKATKL